MAELEKIVEDAERRMKASVESLERELATIRTGRATPTLLDPIKVEYYGTSLPVVQMATVSVPEPRLLVIAPWDQSALQAIERAIMMSGLNLTPQSDGKVIRLQIPPLTEERRRELARLVTQKAEEGKVHVRNVRRDANEHLDKLEKSGGVSEDEVEHGKKRVQQLTDKYIELVGEILDRKAKEIMED
jgi:ribosome recycling factor